MQKTNISISSNCVGMEIMASKGIKGIYVHGEKMMARLSAITTKHIIMPAKEVNHNNRK